MIYKHYFLSLTIRTFLLLVCLVLIAYGITQNNVYIISIGSLLGIIFLYNFYHFITKRFREMDDFFEAVKYRDFSRWYTEDRGTPDIQKLYRGFNLVNKTIKEINNERQAQFLYLQKILEMVDVGIIAYNTETGEVLWTNSFFLDLLDFPNFKNISFVQKRKPKAYDELFETYHPNVDSTLLKMGEEEVKVLISDTIFDVDQTSFKLIMIQNIDETLNRNESDAWKKLLSVMTHEIMNSIAPISSLAETMRTSIEEAQNKPGQNKLDIEDLEIGIESIYKRSEGLMKFAKTYRTLNKISHVNKTAVKANDLFASIRSLIQPTLENKDIRLTFKVHEKDLSILVDTYLIEQVLINIILNAIDATLDLENPHINIIAQRTNRKETLIRIIDNGKGIPEEIIETVFVPFYTTKQQGSGIGLSLCKQIMMLHQGKIAIKSEQGVGTEVQLLFQE
ncbi:ATP-binding protein [Gangjinia marincola]|uniref:histidine kinase n=1 Tax=Gangjinia marincola TaxID=578463 RepID=A0ABN1MGM0_9FLAO